jgi:hypothetical protein
MSRAAEHPRIHTSTPPVSSAGDPPLDGKAGRAANTPATLPAREDGVHPSSYAGFTGTRDRLGPASPARALG